ncbi:MAG: Rv2175c family DNA-binding protein [Micrococcaceae bacterium]
MVNEKNSEIENKVDSWVAIGEVAEQIGTSVPRIKALVDRKALLGIRLGNPPIFSIPAKFIKDGKPLENLKGTLLLLNDAGFSDEEALIWLFTEESSLEAKPIDVLYDGTFKTQVRRVIQGLAW